jgi:hypothetical protein
MGWKVDDILGILDRCAADFSFPALDNGYIYLAAARLSLHRSPEDWALVIERFGFSPRTGIPAIDVQTFASRLHARPPRSRLTTQAKHEKWLANHPHDEFISVYPFNDDAWIEEEAVVEGTKEIALRGRAWTPPLPGAYGGLGIELREPPRVAVFELCRAAAALRRDDVLATAAERRSNVRPELVELLVLDDWHHPDVIGEEAPSACETFRQLAEVLISGDLARYRPTLAPNTHWKHWPEGGSL